MNKFTRVLLSIFLGDRVTKAKAIEKTPVLKDEHKNIPIDVELPPPQDTEDPFKIHNPNEDYDPNDIDLTGEYDPLKEKTVIFSPLSEDIKFFNIYYCELQHDFLLEKSEFSIDSVTETSALLSGAGNELETLFNYIKSNPSQHLLRLYKIQGYIVLGAQELDNHSNNWYYCTLLELPEGRFNPIILTVKKSPKTSIKSNLEYWADHSRPSDGDNK